MSGAIGILTIIFGSGVVVALTAILAGHNRAKTKLQIKLLEKEVELERIRMETYKVETEKMKLDLEQSKQLLVDSRHN